MEVEEKVEEKLEKVFYGDLPLGEYFHIDCGGEPGRGTWHKVHPRLNSDGAGSAYEGPLYAYVWWIKNHVPEDVYLVATDWKYSIVGRESWKLSVEVYLGMK